MLLLKIVRRETALSEVARCSFVAIHTKRFKLSSKSLGNSDVFTFNRLTTGQRLIERTLGNLIVSNIMSTGSNGRKVVCSLASSKHTLSRKLISRCTDQCQAIVGGIGEECEGGSSIRLTKVVGQRSAGVSGE